MHAHFPDSIFIILLGRRFLRHLVILIASESIGMHGLYPDDWDEVMMDGEEGMVDGEEGKVDGEEGKVDGEEVWWMGRRVWWMRRLTHWALFKRPSYIIVADLNTG